MTRGSADDGFRSRLRNEIRTRDERRATKWEQIDTAEQNACDGLISAFYTGICKRR